jgi:hypothetical protein
MGDRLPKQLPAYIWCVVAALLGLSFWFDYYHSPGFLVVDGIILVFLVVVGIKWFRF